MSNLGTVSLNGGGGGGSGTVTSVAMSVPTQFSVAGSPVTTSGTLAVSWVAQVANRVLSGPSSGADAAPTFRALVGDDIPTLAKAKISTAGAWTAPEYVTMVGDSGAGGVKGAVPAPAAGDAAAGKFLKADGTWVTPGGAGTVTSVGLSAPTQFSVSGSPVTGSGTLALSWAVQVANRVLAGPSSGADAAPTFRALVNDDLPIVSVAKGGLGNDFSLTASGSIPYFTGASFGAIGPGAQGTALKMGAAATPEWGTLGVTGGGTGLATLTAYALMAGGTTATGAMQQVSGVGTSGQVLTSNGAGALPTWQNASGGGANTALSNLASVAVNTSIISDTDNTDDLGSSAVRWANVYANVGRYGQSGTYLYVNGSPGAHAGIHISTFNGLVTVGNMGVRLQFKEDSGSCVGVPVSIDFGITAGRRLAFDNTDSAGPLIGNTYFTKSAESGGNFSYFYDNTEVTRDDGTTFRFLQSRKPGLYNAIGDTGPRATFGGSQLVNVTPVGNVGGGVDDLQSVSLKTDTLITNDDRIEIMAAGAYAANGNNKTVQLLFGGTTLFSSGAVAANGGGWVIRATVIRTGATAQVAVGFYVGSSLVTSTVTHTTPAETLSSAIVIKTQGEATADNDVVSKILTVDYFPTK